MDANLVPAEPAPASLPPQARWLGAAAVLLVALMAGAYVYESIAIRRLMADTPIRAAEASRLQQSLGLVNTWMRLQERKGARVVREVTPLVQEAGIASQEVTYTMTPEVGPATVYRVRYRLVPDPGIPGDVRLLLLYPLNQPGEALLKELQLDYVRPESPLPR
ncbi:MAG TPA: hypothetical protein VEI97_12760 [bacterium]|nr:hypothetical protein [bacterium]